MDRNVFSTKRNSYRLIPIEGSAWACVIVNTTAKQSILCKLLSISIASGTVKYRALSVLYLNVRSRTEMIGIPVKYRQMYFQRNFEIYSLLENLIHYKVTLY